MTTAVGPGPGAGTGSAGASAGGAGPASTRLPPGFVVRLSRDTLVRGGGATLLGGSGGALVRLRPRARAVLDGDRVVVRDPDSAALARLLLDRGLADPVWDDRPGGASSIGSDRADRIDPVEAGGGAGRGYGHRGYGHREGGGNRDGGAGRDAGGNRDGGAGRDAGRLADERAGADVTVVVPVRDRPEQLARLLAALPRGVPVVVVDDGSRDPAAVASVARVAGAELVVHEANRGPAAARNTGLARARTAYVALVDSDVVPDPGWLAALRRHLEDPAVAAVGPRVRGLRTDGVAGAEGTASTDETAGADEVERPERAGRAGRAGRRGRGWLERYEAARSPLDLGPTPAAVRPHGRVAYLPSATLLVRREAWVTGCSGSSGSAGAGAAEAAGPAGSGWAGSSGSGARPGRGLFDEDLRVAEDVDAVWRLCAAGWRVRYAPEAVVRHDHRTTTSAWLARRAYYGSGAALLAERHGSAVAPVVLTPWTTALTLAALAQRRWSAPALGLLALAGVASTARRLGDAEDPVRTAATVHLLGAVATGRQTAASLTRHHWPLALGAAVVSRRARRAWVVAAVAQGLADHRRVRPDLDPARYVLALRLDDLAYGAGVWAGAWRARSPRALLPRWRGPGSGGGTD